MDMAAVMTAIKDCLHPAVVDHQAFDYPTLTVNPPTVVVGYPEGPQPYDATFSRGLDRALFPCWIVVGDIVRRESREKLTPYITAAKAALEPDLDGAVESARVTEWSIEPFSTETLDYVSVKLTIDVLT
jgi:hypothetical protein